MRESATTSESYEIHDLVRIETRLGPSQTKEWQEMLGGARRHHSGHDLPTLRIGGPPNELPTGLRKMGWGFDGTPGALHDTEYSVLLQQAHGVPMIATRDAGLEWGMFLLQYALLCAQSTFIHGAGVEKDGKSILFPSWGGVGKTALIGRLVREDGWRLLGDDLVIVRADGVALAFPKPMVLYPYHRILFPEVFDAGAGPIAPVWLNPALDRVAQPFKRNLRRFPNLLAAARRRNPQSVRIPPSLVFGAAAMATSAPVDTVVWLERAARRGTSIEATDPSTNLSRILGSTINEFDHRVVMASNMAAGLELLDAHLLYSEWDKILTNAIQPATHLTVQVPVNVHLADMPGAVLSALKSAEVV